METANARVSVHQTCDFQVACRIQASLVALNISGAIVIKNVLKPRVGRCNFVLALHAMCDGFKRLSLLRSLGPRNVGLTALETE